MNLRHFVMVAVAVGVVLSGAEAKAQTSVLVAGGVTVVNGVQAVAPAVRPTDGTIVKNNAELMAAVTKHKNGGKIYLEKGVYTAVLLRNVKPTAVGGLTFRSVDPANPALIGSIRLIDVANLTLSDLEFGKTGVEKLWQNIVDIVRGQNIKIERSKVVGPLTGDRGGIGISAALSSQIKVVNNKFTRLMRGAVFSSVNGLDVSNNVINDNRAEGFNFAQVKNVVIANNKITNFVPQMLAAGQGDHPDAIQFWTTRTKESSENILISGNYIAQKNGQAQGIFMRDDLGFPYKNVRILNNVVYTGMGNGIMLGDSENSLVQGNIVITPSASLLHPLVSSARSMISIRGGKNAVMKDNIATGFALTVFDPVLGKDVNSAGGTDGNVVSGNYTVKRTDETKYIYLGLLKNSTPVVKMTDIFVNDMPADGNVTEASFRTKPRSEWPTASTTR